MQAGGGRILELESQLKLAEMEACAYLYDYGAYLFPSPLFDGVLGTTYQTGSTSSNQKILFKALKSAKFRVSAIFYGVPNKVVVREYTPEQISYTDFEVNVIRVGTTFTITKPLTIEVKPNHMYGFAIASSLGDTPSIGFSNQMYFEYQVLEEL